MATYLDKSLLIIDIDNRLLDIAIRRRSYEVLEPVKSGSLTLL